MWFLSFSNAQYITEFIMFERKYNVNNSQLFKSLVLELKCTLLNMDQEKALLETAQYILLI